MSRSIFRQRWGAMALAGALLLPMLAACSGSDALVIYSGRQKPLVGELLDQLSKKIGVEVEVRYGQSPELAHQLAEEGADTDADVFFSQDAGALGALSKHGMLSKLPQQDLDVVEERFRAKNGTWVGTSARARVVAYDPKQVEKNELPRKIDDVVDPKWKGKVAYAPTNASWLSFVTAVRELMGEQAAKEWLTKFKANEPQTYPNNLTIRDAVDSGEVALGLINHYYWFKKVDEEGAENVNVKLHYVGGDDPLALVNVAGVGVLKNSDKAAQARKAVRFLLSEQAQRYFADHEAEYPVRPGVQSTKHKLPKLSEIESPEIDLNALSSLEETEKLLQEVGLS